MSGKTLDSMIKNQNGYHTLHLTSLKIEVMKQDHKNDMIYHNVDFYGLTKYIT